MLNEQVLSIPESIHSRESYILFRPISAIRLRVDAVSHLGKFGEVVQLQPGERLDCCGEGYNERSVKVHSAGQFYCVFIQDLRDAQSDHF